MSEEIVPSNLSHLQSSTNQSPPTTEQALSQDEWSYKHKRSRMKEVRGVDPTHFYTWSLQMGPDPLFGERRRRKMETDESTRKVQMKPESKHEIMANTARTVILTVFSKDHTNLYPDCKVRYSDGLHIVNSELDKGLWETQLTFKVSSIPASTPLKPTYFTQKHLGSVLAKTSLSWITVRSTKDITVVITYKERPPPTPDTESNNCNVNKSEIIVESQLERMQGEHSWLTKPINTLQTAIETAFYKNVDPYISTGEPTLDYDYRPTLSVEAKADQVSHDLGRTWTGRLQFKFDPPTSFPDDGAYGGDR